MNLIPHLEAIEKAPLGNARLEKIKELDCPELRELLNYVLSPDITFGIKQLPVPKKNIDPFQLGDWFGHLTPLLDQLADRELTGNAAKEKIQKFLEGCSSVQIKWTERILMQDLRLSTGAKDINKILPNTIRVFEIPLAKPFKELKSLKGRWALQPKMDGGRVVTRLRKAGGKVTLYSRTGKEWKGFEGIKENLTKLNAKLNLAEDYILDGEIVVFDKTGRMNFQAAQRLFHAEDREQPEGTTFIIFDFCPMSEYFNPHMIYELRLALLHTQLVPHLMPWKSLKVNGIRSITTQVVTDPEQDELDAKAVMYVEKFGCDGAIIRRLDTIPRNKKTADIIKVKPFEDGEAIIEDMIEGKGHLEGSMGTLVCRMLDQKSKKATGPQFEIGTGEGLTKDLREELWNDPKTKGSFANFKYQRISNDGMPVLPTLRGIRHPEDM